ncbi:polyhydroxyalkanoate synthase [Oceanospirillum multiglobuliferum]|uniref:Class I poly(R)-hydroxyalkanoic acid synthase n=1 Tax=Oceanospirillum multiglobuliferum TaxID=64969 RepID=A0A1T4N0Q0_9GAMM|nr:class I poly(R)-hydroxyalkanoic acid synthase [Oceanospirillum multiglobuliferum]OPX55800.1 class I poly(R)-hydroxyalkanoic acid synthase [Oceanospirillum multiglobuliferum]SJZ72869.1 polyhydroxyalkanoate synthase [Oceanospirillum multiglobuliferum]
MSEQTKDGNNFFYDPAELADIVGKANNQYQKLIEQLMSRQSGMSDPSLSIFSDVSESFQKMAEQIAVNPMVVYEEQMNLWKSQIQLWQNATRQLLGETVDPVIEPARDDRRFTDAEWVENSLFDFIKQSYLLFSRSMFNMVHNVEGLSDHSRQTVDFYARQYINAMSPSNFVATNPEVLRRTIETKGRNLIQGMEQLVEDLKSSRDGLNVSMTDARAFTMGVNVATTPGEVVYQNDLMQLIQYKPSTEKAFKTPLLIVPPWINKYYILDLRPGNSLVKWLVEQGHTVFIISWVNPGPKLRDKSFENYMLEGPLAAIDAIEQATGEKEVNLISYCIGGTLTASTLAYMAANNDKRVKSATYMATLQDFTDPGEIGVFINESSLKGIEKQLDRDGYLDGRAMSFSFNLLRENDLFWSFFINNYLKGERPTAFDLLYWNTDSTNMPAAMHKFYLRNMYLENNLIKPGGISLNGTPIDLTKIETPVYFVSTIQDHIAKWTATYKGAQAHSGPVKFVLAGSGHIAGVVNPPDKKKYGFWTNDTLAETPDAWFAGAEKHEGSWWPNWQDWVTSNQYADPKAMVAAREPGKGKLKVIEAAPGSYAAKKIVDVLKADAAEAVAS